MSPSGYKHSQSGITFSEAAVILSDQVGGNSRMTAST